MTGDIRAEIMMIHFSINVEVQNIKRSIALIEAHQQTLASIIYHKPKPALKLFTGEADSHKH